MTKTNLQVSLTALAMLAAMMFLAPYSAHAHCDGLDGPVVKAAQKALAEGNVNHLGAEGRRSSDFSVGKANKAERSAAVRMQ
jgi:hypothetical protein